MTGRWRHCRWLCTSRSMDLELTRKAGTLMGSWRHYRWLCTSRSMDLELRSILGALILGQAPMSA